MKLRNIGLTLNTAGTFIWPVFIVSFPLIFIGFILIAIAEVKTSYDI